MLYEVCSNLNVGVCASSITVQVGNLRIILLVWIVSDLLSMERGVMDNVMDHCIDEHLEILGNVIIEDRGVRFSATEN